ncbi:MAG TPA: small multi-drug export protein [Candidatus Caccovivens faecavium]|nr:small multi-drug export protein [Candidatus Caccovivens faecavium]
MVEFFVDNFSSCVFLAVILMALIPTIESKIAIPFGLSYAIWGEATLSPIVAFICAYIGSMLPSIFIIIIVRKLKNRTSGFVCDKLINSAESKYHRKLELLSSKSKTFYKLSSLALFVAVPLPLTGVYSGSLIAGLSNLKIYQAFIAIAIGEFISCLAITLLCVLFENSTLLILLASLIILVIFIVFDIVFMLIKRQKKLKIN